MVCEPIGRCGSAANVVGRVGPSTVSIYGGTIHAGRAESLEDCLDRAGWFWIGAAVVAGLAVVKSVAGKGKR